MLLALALVLLHGTVTIGPITPVCSAATPCTKRAAHVTLTFSRPGRVLRTTTDASGRYRLSLPPGAWNLRASAGMSMRPAAIWVPRLTSVRRDFAIDTGIR